MNNNNSGSTPGKTTQEASKTSEPSKPLRMQFPVSSGQLHRKKESDRGSLSSKNEQRTHHYGFGHHNSNNIATAVVQPMTVPVSYPGQHMMVQPGLYTSQHHHHGPLPPCGPGQLIAYPTPLPHDQMYGGPQGFEDQYGAGSDYDITNVVTHRLSALKGLQHDPNDEEVTGMNRGQEGQSWMQHNYEPGHFTGTTGAQVLSQAELASGTQAWVRRDQMNAAAPVQSGMGMAMLQKMGWKPGEGLGKNKEGTLEPPKLHFKMDKKGLVAPDEVHYNPPQSKDIAKNFYEGKHPVSLLNELCLRKHYGPPIFDCCYETGPDHKKNFIFKVTVNGVEYKPSAASQNKKQAKVEAATLCLRALGLIY